MNERISHTSNKRPKVTRRNVALADGAVKRIITAGGVMVIASVMGITENPGPNRERKAGGWGESMVLRGALERCEKVANPLETRGKRKPVTPENDPRETGLSFLNGGGEGSRTPVRKS